MLHLFGKKTKKEKLSKKYKKLLEQAHRLSHYDRKAADLKTVEAELVLQEIEKLS